MLKRLIAIICIFVLIFVLAMPCYAETQPDYVDHLNLEYSYSDDLSGVVISFRGDIKVSFNEDCFYFKDLIFVCSPFGFQGFSIDLDGYYSRVIEADPSDAIYVFDSSSIGGIVYDLNSMSVYYFEEDVVYASSNCRTFGFSFVVTEGGSGGFTQEDLDSAYSEGYDDGVADGYNSGYDKGLEDLAAVEQKSYSDGFFAGQESINQDAIHQEGYDEGFVAGAESIDQDAIRQEGYDEGFAVGQDEGYNAALDQFGSLSGGVFEYLVLDVLVYHDLDEDGRENTVRLQKVPFDKTLGGIYFKSTLDYLINKFGTDEFNRVDLILKFDSGYYVGQDPLDWSASPIFISGSTLVESAEITTVEGVVYSLSGDDSSSNSQSKRSFMFVDIDKVVFPVIVKQFSLMVGRPGDLLNEISLWCNSEFYSYGYAAGYAEGLSSDSTESYNTGYNSGYGTGFLEGKNEGLNLGKAGDWKSLMTAVVEAPINTFQSLFNFEILGLDMRAAFGSILAVCVILIIIKKVIL